MFSKISARSIFATSLKTAAILATLFAVYYFSVMRPALAVPRTLNEAEKMIANHNLNLVQNRTTLTAFTRLNLQSATFADEKKQILERLLETNRMGLVLTGKEERLPRLPLGVTSDLRSFLDTELPEKFSQLQEEERQIFNEQKDLIERLAEFATITNDIFSYNPAVDLGRLDPQNEQGELTSRAGTAREGLQTIALKLNDKEFPFDAGQLIQELNRSQQLLGEFVRHLENENFAQAHRTREELIMQFGKAQRAARELELSLIRSSDSVKLATRQTNLIREFNFLLQKINHLQQKVE